MNNDMQEIQMAMQRMGVQQRPAAPQQQPQQPQVSPFQANAQAVNAQAQMAQAPGTSEDIKLTIVKALVKTLDKLITPQETGVQPNA